MQCVDVVRWQRAKAEAHFGARRDHVGLDAAFDLADVETQARQAAETTMRFGFDHIQCGCAPAHRVMQRAAVHGIRTGRMPGGAAERHQHRADAPMREHRFALGGFGDDGFAKAVIARQKCADAARVVGFFVAAEQKSRVA